MGISHEHEMFFLKSQLIEFGLKPEDWTLRSESSGEEITIEHVNEPDFRFGGTTEVRKGSIVWRRIFLKSV